MEMVKFAASIQIADRAMSNLEHQRGVQPIENEGETDV